jgi:hypothetical protein
MWIFMGWKTIETRLHARFKGLVGKRIAIHAAKTKIDGAAFFCQWFYDAVEKVGGPLAVQNQMMLAALWRGKILCTAVVVDAKLAPNVGFVEHEEWNKKAMCEVASKFCLFLDDVKKFKEPITYKGGRGIFNVPEELLDGANG